MTVLCCVSFYNELLHVHEYVHIGYCVQVVYKYTYVLYLSPSGHSCIHHCGGSSDVVQTGHGHQEVLLPVNTRHGKGMVIVIVKVCTSDRL